MHYLACDLGAESGRLMLGTLEDGRLSLEELHRFPNGPVETKYGLCWDVPRLFAELKIGLKIAAGHKLPIKSISCDAWGLDYFLLDESGEVMEPTFCYRDGRNQRGIDRAMESVSWETIYEETGVQFVQINSLFQMAAESTERIEQMHTFMPLGDGFNYLLYVETFIMKVFEIQFYSASLMMNCGEIRRCVRDEGEGEIIASQKETANDLRVL